MSLEGERGIPRQESRPIFEIGDNKVQREIMVEMYHRNHPGVTEASSREIGDYWVENNFATRWREFVDQHEEDKIIITEENISQLCGQAFPEAKPTLH